MGAPGHDPLKSVAQIRLNQETTMSAPQPHHDAAKTEDVVEGIVKHMHVVLPVVGAVLIFLLAFIAVAMA